MIRRLFHFGCAVSLLLCVLVIAIWVRSYSISEDINWQTATRLNRFRWSAGEFLITTTPAAWPAGVWRLAYPANDLGGAFSQAVGMGYVLGFGFGRTNDGRTIETAVIFPLWFVALLLLVPLFLAWRDYRKRLGSCPKCGYDLRASKDRCPECGKPISAEAMT